MNESIWHSKYSNKFSDKDLDNVTDILIIGGGITGITLGYFLKDYKKKVMLIDKGHVCSGTTKNTSAKLNYLQGNYGKIVDTFDKETANMYYKSQVEAINIVNNIISVNNIKCDLEKVKSILFCLEKKNKKIIKKERHILEEFGASIKKVYSRKICYGISVNDTYVFNPLKYLDGIINVIKDKINIYEEILAYDIKSSTHGYVVKTNKGNIKCKQLVLACHYPFKIVNGFVPFKTYVEREYVNVGDVGYSKKYTAINVSEDLHSIRFYKDKIIYVSNNHKITDGKFYSHYVKSIGDFKKYFHVDSIKTWINQDVCSYDHLPLIGKIKNNMYIATGFNAWGMTNGTIAGKLISDLIINNYNEYEKVFNPSRFNVTMFMNLTIGMINYTCGYIRGLFKKDNPSFIKVKGIVYGVYTDSEGIKHKVKLICPHMKGLLIFNKADMTWDCPLHGSRFSIDGKLIQGPANHDICK